MALAAAAVGVAVAHLSGHKFIAPLFFFGGLLIVLNMLGTFELLGW